MVMEKGLFTLLGILKSRSSTPPHTQQDTRPLLSQDRPAANKHPWDYIQDAVVAHAILPTPERAWLPCSASVQWEGLLRRPGDGNRLDAVELKS